MASANLKKALECSICLSLYTDPIILKCGHNFCQACISRVFDTQEKSGIYSCPECREEFLKRPPLQRNIGLNCVVENFRSTQPDQEETEVLCTYCIHSAVPAIKSCLLCEASMCQDHLKVHSRSPEHVLCEPSNPLENGKCSIHKKSLEYYCMEDAACICSSCTFEDHRGHKMEPLHKASNERKKKLRNILQKLKTVEEEVKKSVQSLQKQLSKIKEQAADETERVAALFRDIRGQLEDLEKRVLLEISRQAEHLSCSDMIQQLEVKKDKLSGKLLEIEGLCNLTEPLAVLQKSDTLDLRNIEEESNKNRGRYDKQLQDMDVTWVSHTLCRGLSDILTSVNGGIYIPGPADILLDEDTANDCLRVSDDRKTASSSSNQSRLKTRKRFQSYSQVLSCQNFSSGQHYWEVDVGRSNNWIVGVCYPSVPKKGDESIIGNNSKSWGIDRRGNKYTVTHNDLQMMLPVALSSDRVRVYLDYEAGQLSFYDLLHPMRHLHTFTATFTEPLHAAFFVNHGSIDISEGGARV